MSNMKESLVYDTFEPPSHSMYEVIDSLPPPPQPFLHSPSNDEYSKITRVSVNTNEKSYSIDF